MVAQLVVRRIDDLTEAKLKARAARDGVSMEEEVRMILQDALSRDGSNENLGTRIANLFRGAGIEGEPLERLPSSEIKPATFDR